MIVKIALWSVFRVENAGTYSSLRFDYGQAKSRNTTIISSKEIKTMRPVVEQL